MRKEANNEDDNRNNKGSVMNNRNAAIFFLASGMSLLLSGQVNSASASQQAKSQRDDSKTGASLIREVRHQLVMLPYYSVFDNLTYSVEGDNVTLNGQVTRPTLKSDAESAVKSIEGV